MPFPKNYKPISASVQVPSPQDPVDISQQGGTTYMDFGMPDVYAAQRGGMRPVTQREIASDALQRAMMGIPDLPSDLSPGSLEMMRQSIPAMPTPLQTEKAKPQQSYGTNRGGTGSAGRGPQLGKSQFDVGPQFAEPDTGMSIADLRKLDDKPWELDDNTKADVAPGTSFEPQKDNVTDTMPDLNTPQGLYSALAKKYPDMLQQNLDQVQQARVSMEDVDALRDRAGLGSLFIAASKAASGAGSIGGKTAESIAEKIVTREDTLARQQLKDRLDVASENMAMNAKAVDLAMKQINFADEREQYDPNSDVSQFARDFMQQEFDVKVPANVPAYQLKQFLPAIVQKYQAQERATYQRALLGYRETPEQAATRRKTEAEAERKFKAGESKLERQLRLDLQRERQEKGGATGPKVISGTDIPKDVADKEFSIADKFNNEPSVKKFKQGNIALQEMQKLAKEQSTFGDQGLISGYAKILDPESVVREGEYAVVERGGGLLAGIQNRIDILQGKARLQPAQREALISAAQALQNGRRSEYQRIRSTYEQRARQYGLDPIRALGTDETPAGGETLPSGKKRLTPEDRQKLENYRRRKAGGQ